jgi:hypothetical protein
MDKVVFFLRNGGVIISQLDGTKSDDVSTIAYRMTSDGYIVCTDSLWGRRRHVVVSLGDVSCAVVYPEEYE